MLPLPNSDLLTTS